jgi:hypothetical protein
MGGIGLPELVIVLLMVTAIVAVGAAVVRIGFRRSPRDR